MAKRSMDKEEITGMYNEQKKVYLEATDFNEDNVNFDKKRFFKDARKFGWDIEIDKYATVKRIELDHGAITPKQISLVYCYGVTQGLIDETDETDLKLMLKNAKEKSKLHETHYSEEFDNDEIIPILKSVELGYFEVDLIDEYLNALEEMLNVGKV